MLCPVGAYTLIDRTLDRLINAGFSTSVNVHAHAEMLTEHVRDRAFVSVESPEALGTAGAIAKLRPWFAGRSVLAVNADTVSDADLGEITALRAPHRIADALLRDALLDGVPFRSSAIGKAFTDARVNHATAMY